MFLSRSVLGRVLRPPAQAVAPLPPEIHANLSNRERVALQTQPETCQGCHAMINPLGFTMENFDAIGRYRESPTRTSPIDATGSYLTQSGEVEKFKGEEDLAKFLAASEESQDAFVKQLFHHTVKQPIRAYGPTPLKDLQNIFAKHDLQHPKAVCRTSSPPVRRQSSDEASAKSCTGVNYRGLAMTTYASRREFLRNLGIGAAAVPFVLNLPSLGLAAACVPAPAAPGRHVQPQRRRSPKNSGPTNTGADFKFKEILKPLEPFKDRTLVLNGISDRIRGDGDNHMRGIGCLLTGIELFPGNIQGGSDTPAGWVEGHLASIRKSKTSCRRTPQPARASARSSSASWSPIAPTPGRACPTPAPTSRSRRSTTRTRCSPSSTAA